VADGHVPPNGAKRGGATARAPARELPEYTGGRTPSGDPASRIDVRLPLDLADVGGLEPLRPLRHLELDLVAP